MRWSRTVYVNITDSQISVERPDVGHGITYRDGGESCTFCECLTPDTGHGITYREGSEP